MKHFLLEDKSTQNTHKTSTKMNIKGNKFTINFVLIISFVFLIYVTNKQMTFNVYVNTYTSDCSGVHWSI